MTRLLTRRHLALGLTTLVGTASIPAWLAHAAPGEAAIAAIEARHGGRLGVFVLDTGSGRTLAHRADERFLLASTFKGLLAAMLLSRVDAGRDALDNPVRYGAKDLLPASPVTTAHVQQGVLTVGELTAAILQYSDNTAANLLLARVGGPAGLTAYVRGLGDPVTRLDDDEPNVGIRRGDLDTTTPRAIVGSARTVLLGNALGVGARTQLERWMDSNVVGRTRLRAAFPPAWTAGDRTGTADGICNDYAIARRPGKPPLLMAAYYDAPGQEMAPQEAVLREVGRAIVAWAG
ncbi:class A beta-lactamase [Lichenicola sp.]|uniref:class A beta-lactamase n=1 Tax=Lichenicola sp. TaxID=2804529 RepID=UPI003AFFE663